MIRRRRRFAPLVALIGAFGAAACGDDASPDSGVVDSGSPVDTGAVSDAAIDAGIDAGVEPDAGVDAGEPDSDGGSFEIDCTGVTSLDRPVDPWRRGPWPVGARTVDVDGLTVEVWYPASPGSESSTTTTRYDIRRALPASEIDKIPDDENPWQACDCYRDLAIDDGHGPYPIVLFVHGTAGFRTQSLELMVHWASRGFVVLSADHPGLWLADLLGGLPCGGTVVPGDVEGDLSSILAAVRAAEGDLDFLSGRIDADRVGMAGHSAGGRAISEKGDDAVVLMPLASGGVVPGARLKSTLVMAGTADAVIPYTRTSSAYEASPSPKHFVGISNAGHLAFSSLCSLENTAGEDIVAIGVRNGVCGISLAGQLFDCDPEYLADPVAWDIVHGATSWALESELTCTTSTATLSDLEAAFGDIEETRASP